MPDLTNTGLQWNDPGAMAGGVVDPTTGQLIPPRINRRKFFGHQSDTMAAANASLNQAQARNADIIPGNPGTATFTPNTVERPPVAIDPQTGASMPAAGPAALVDPRTGQSQSEDQAPTMSVTGATAPTSPTNFKDVPQFIHPKIGDVDPNGSLGNPALTKLGKLGVFLMAAAKGGAMGSQFGNFGQGYEAASVEPLQEQQRKAQVQRTNLENQHLQGQIGLLPWEYASRQAALAHTQAETAELGAHGRLYDAIAPVRGTMSTDQQLSAREATDLAQGINPETDPALIAMQAVIQGKHRPPAPHNPTEYQQFQADPEGMRQMYNAKGEGALKGKYAPIGRGGEGKPATPAQRAAVIKGYDKAVEQQENKISSMSYDTNKGVYRDLNTGATVTPDDINAERNQLADSFRSQAGQLGIPGDDVEKVVTGRGIRASAKTGAKPGGNAPPAASTPPNPYSGVIPPNPFRKKKQ